MGILDDLNMGDLEVKSINTIEERNTDMSQIQTFKKDNHDEEDKSTLNQMDIFAITRRAVEAEMEAAAAKQRVAELEKQLNTQAQQTVQQQVQQPMQQQVQQPMQSQMQQQIQPQIQQQQQVPEYLQNQNSVQDNILLDIAQSTVDTFRGISGLVNMISKPTASKAKQLGHIAWSKKQDAECMARFKNGQIVSTGGFRFSVTQTEIMVLSYYGPDTILKIPSEIKGRLVTAISPNFLSCRNLRGTAQLIMGNSANADISSIKQCMTCVKQIRLPKYVNYLPTQIFEGCKSLETVVIPAAVKAVSCFFLEGSGVKQILFEGPYPSNLREALENHNVSILCSPQYKSTFQNVPNLQILER